MRDSRRIRLSGVVAAMVICGIAVRFLFGWYVRQPPDLSGWYYDVIARDLLTTRDLGVVAQQGLLVERMPLYPAALAVTYALFGRAPLVVLLLHSLIGGGIILLAFLIGRQLYDTAVGLLAALLTALYPYYVGNNVGLSDEPLFTLLLATAVLCALELVRHPTLPTALVVGFFLGSALLTRSAVLIFIPFLVVWLWLYLPAPALRKLALTGGVLLTCGLALVPWLATTYRVLGQPTLTGHVGLPLWNGNNPTLLDCGYPTVTIDYCSRLALTRLAEEDGERLRELSKTQLDSAMGARALEYIGANPLSFFQRGLVKLWAGFGWQLNPYLGEDLAPTGPWWKFAGHSVSFLPLALLALYAFARDWRQRRAGLTLIALLYLSFAIGFFVFWAHTAHRSPLDLYMLVLAAAALVGTAARVNPIVDEFKRRWKLMSG